MRYLLAALVAFMLASAAQAHGPEHQPVPVICEKVVEAKKAVTDAKSFAEIYRAMTGASYEPPFKDQDEMFRLAFKEKLEDAKASALEVLESDLAYVCAQY